MHIILILIAIGIVISIIGGIISFVLELVCGIWEMFCELIDRIIRFVRKHWKAIVSVLLVCCLIVFGIAYAEELTNIVWDILYQNTTVNAIWIYWLIWCTISAFAHFLITVIQKDSHRIWFNIILSMIVLIMGGATDVYNEFMICIIDIVFISCCVLISFVKKSAKKIGCASDVLSICQEFYQKHLHIVLFGMLSVLGIPIKNANEFFDTSIPVCGVYFVLCLKYFIDEVILYRKAFKGYKAIKSYISKTPFFDFTDVNEISNLDYLKKKDEYIFSVLDKFRAKKNIYLMPLGKHVYMNRALYKSFEKAINSNKSSKEIEKITGSKFKEYSFETVYKSLFAQIKKYTIEFEANHEVAEKKRMSGDISAIEFVLMRYPIEEHPLLKEDVKTRVTYVIALNAIVQSIGIDSLLWNAKLDEYKQGFDIVGEDFRRLDGETAISIFSKVVKRKEGAFKIIKTDYSYLLLLESLYFKNLLTEKPLSYQEIEQVFEKLAIKQAHRDFIYQYIKHMFLDDKADEAEALLMSAVKIDIQRVLTYVHRNIMWNERYEILPQYHVAVCATMSAGKSTFINALLGKDYIPAKNEACTAKVTTIRDNDNLKKLIGYYVRNDGSRVYSNTIDRMVLEQWNEDTNVSETIIEGNIEEVSTDKGILVVHDTPGTNNSGDTSHHDKTIEFLEHNYPDIVTFLVNAEYISTTDSEVLLKEIQSISKKNNGKIVFILNKIDCFDEESGESLDVAMEGLEKQLQTYGFEKPLIFPLSANAARLFKLVIKGEEISRRERRNFSNLLEKFSSSEMKLTVVNALDIQEKKYHELTEDKVIIVGEEEYSYNQIIQALNNTGINAVEAWFARQINEL